MVRLSTGWRWAGVVLLGLLLGGCAADRARDRGRAALLRDDPVQARYHFEQALQLDPDLAQKAEFQREYRQAQLEALVAEGRSAVERGSPRLAMERFTAALALEPGYAPAEQGLAQALADAAEQAFADALRQADAGDLVRAEQLVNEALLLDPAHAGAGRARASLALPLIDPPDTWAPAKAAVVARRWDEALRLTEQTIADDPYWILARGSLPTVRQQAVDHTLSRARDALDQAQFDTAAALFKEVGNYQPGQADIEPGLAAVALARGDFALADQYPGLALLHYRASREHLQKAPTPQDDAAATRGIATATELLLNPLIQPVHLNFELANSPTTDPLGPPLIEAARTQLQRDARAALRLDAAGLPITLRIVGVDLPVATRVSEARTHPYQVEDRIPNPVIPDLNRSHFSAEVRVSNLRSRESGLNRRYDMALRRGDTFALDRLGQEVRELRRELREAERELDRIDWALRTEPDFLTRVRTEQWPYTVHTYSRAGALLAAWRVEQEEAQQVTARYDETDTSLDNPRPELGLPEDPLELATDAVIRQRLATEAGQQIGRDLTQLLVGRRLAELRQQAEANAGDAAAVRELDVAAAVLSRAVDANAADATLREMQERWTE